MIAPGHGKLLIGIAMNRLYEQGFISNPVGKAKSVLLTDKGLQESERLFSKLFVKRAP